jgi:DDE superfamily endonuclease
MTNRTPVREQIRAACAAGVQRGVVLTDASYGSNAALRESVSALALGYVAGIAAAYHDRAPRALPSSTRCTTSLENTHGTESRELLWFGLHVCIHDAIDRAGCVVFRCTLSGSDAGCCLEVPAHSTRRGWIRR